MLVLICGSRGFDDTQAIRAALGRLPAETHVIHGDAKGADRLAAELAAREFGLTVTAHPADWSTHGRRAGILRNLAMLDQHPDLVIGFWDGHSPGTGHTLSQAAARGIPVWLPAHAPAPSPGAGNHNTEGGSIR